MIPWRYLLQMHSATGQYSDLFISLACLAIGVLHYFTSHKLNIKANDRYYENILKDSCDLFDLATDDNFRECVRKVKNYLGNTSNIRFKISGSPYAQTNLIKTLKFDTPNFFQITGGQIIEIPSTFIWHLRGDPDVLTAALIHESAHFLNRDSFFIHVLGRAKKSIAISVLLNLVLELIISVYHDAPRAVESTTIVASLVGKGYLLTTLGAVAVIYVVHSRLLLGLREALADHDAIRVCGIDAMHRLDELITQHGYAESRGEESILREKNLNPTQAWILAASLFAGILIYGAASYISSPFIFLTTQAFNDQNEHVHAFISVIFQSIILSGLYVSMLSITMEYGDRKKDIIGSILANGLMMLSGLFVGNLLLQNMPIILSSVAMPAGFSAPGAHIMDMNFLRFIYAPITSHSFDILLISVSAFLSISLNSYVGVIPVVLWIIFSVAEVNYLPALLYGWLSPIICTAAAIIVALWGKCIIFQRTYLSRLGFLLLSLLSVICFIQFMGVGDSNHFAASNSSAAMFASREGKSEEAVYFYERALRNAPNVYQAWKYLADELVISGRLKEAVEATKGSISVASSWNHQFESLVRASELALAMGKNGDLTKVESYFERAEELWRRGYLLSQKQAAYLMYNFACLKALQSKKAEAAAYLLESLILAPELSQKADEDTDLAILGLKNTPPTLTPSEREFLINYDGAVTAPNILMMIKEGHISIDSVIAILKKA